MFWNKYSWPQSYKYSAIAPQSIEIVIAETASVDQAIALFSGMSISGGEAGPDHLGWPQFVREKLPPKIALRYLEPYVARYVKAVSSCGVFTCESCDGNHEGDDFV